MAAAAAAGRATVACLQVEGAFRLLQGAVEISDGWCVGPCVHRRVRFLCSVQCKGPLRAWRARRPQPRARRPQARAATPATAVGRLDVLVLL